MVPKTIVTRIKNKVDTLAKWQSYTGTLLDGEIVVVRVPTESTYTNPVTGEDEPVVELLMKVGDGSSTFANLPWMSAKASDVYDWAKAATVVFNENNYHLEFRAPDDTVIAYADLVGIDTRLVALESKKITVTPNDNSKPGVVQSVTQGDATHEIDVTYGLVKTADIDAKQVTAAKIADSTITATQLADNAVTTAKIKNANVTDAKIATGVSSDKITVKNTTDNLTTKLESIDASIASMQAILSKGIIFRGEVASAPSGTTYTLKDTSTAVNAIVGDMVICGEKEYVYTADSTWKELGDLSRVGTLETWRTKLVKNDTAVTNQFVTEVDIAADGTVTINRAQPTSDDVKHGTNSTVSAKLNEIDAALANKSDKDHTHSDYVNQNAFSNIKVGNTTVAADTATDTVEFVGSNVTIIPDTSNDKITFAVAEGTTEDKGIVKLNDTYTGAVVEADSTTAATTKAVKLIDAEAKDAASRVAAIENNYVRVDEVNNKNTLVWAEGETVSTIIFECGGAEL